jgi:phosphotransferase system IIB component
MDKQVEQGQYQVIIGRGTAKIGSEIKHSIYVTSAQMGEPPRTTRKEGV